MRNDKLQTPFWRNAAQRLPRQARARYIGYFELAERWELALDAIVELVGRAKTLFHTPSHTRSA